MQPENELIKVRLEKLNKWKELGINPYPYKFDQTHHSTDVIKKAETLKPGDVSKKFVKIAGRVMAKRVMGNASFIQVQDQEGTVQVYFTKNELKEFYKKFSKLLDIGDIVGVYGKVFKTHKGEPTVHALSIELLSKNLRPLPEKYHGLTDPELRYRQRYVDLFTNPEVRKVFETRAKIISAVREFLESKGFIEAEIPILQPIYGGANARPFKTHINAWDFDMYLSISPELYLKRLIVGGFEKVYYLGKNFRNEGVDKTHNPEFTMMECYQAYADYYDMMELTEDLYVYVCNKVLGTTKVKYGDKIIDFKKPWKRLPMKEAIKKYAEIDVDKMDDEEIKTFMRNFNIEYEGDYSRDLAIELIFEELCEDKIIQPTFITEHPVASTALCKVKREDNSVLERFEPFVNGWEIGNAYSELNDPIKQRELLKEQEEKGRGGDEEFHPMDEDYVQALEYGMAPTGGLGLGIDRMVMLLTNSATIRDVILFPTMKPKED
ncbi:lysine--tRNA ligase [Candidatus Woesearchaeota archaeon]|nr:MAG: lysine--tRNA ligase [Candidatus Woesearchaeota archaeon]